MMSKLFDSVAISPIAPNPIFYPELEESGSLSDFILLLKPRVTMLVVFTAFIGLTLAPGHIHPFLAFVTLLCVALSSGASGCINMWYERETDALMSRTKNRPLPAGRVQASTALSYGIILNVIAVMVQGLAVSWLSALYLLSASLFYIFIYTILLKRRTPQNIVIGGAAGAFPPIIGWVAVSGELSLLPILMFLIVFFWTPPHFWALALHKNEDYQKANIPMLPVVKGQRHTQVQILIYSFLLVIVTSVPFFLNLLGPVYLGVCLILNLIFMYDAWLVYRKADKKNNLRLFFYSIFYLFALFTAMLLDHYLM